MPPGPRGRRAAVRRGGRAHRRRDLRHGSRLRPAPPGRALKTAVWAHSFHLAKDADASSWSTRTIALIANVAEIDWLGVGCGETQHPGGERTVENMLHGLGHETLLVDLDFPGGKPPLLAPGESYRMSEAGMTPADQFDGAFFLERSHKMDPLRWPSCR